MTIVLSVIYVLVMLVFVIIFLVAWRRHRNQVRHFKHYGIRMAAAYLGLEFIAYIGLSVSDVAVPFCGVIFSEAIGFFRVAAFTIMGIYYCALNGLPSFPLFMKKYGAPQTPTPDIFQVPDNLEERRGEAAQNIDPLDDSWYEPPVEIVLPHINMRRYATAVLAVSFGAIGYSSALFWLTKPQMSDLVRQYIGPSITSAQVFEVNFLNFIMVITFAFVEELTFRLGIQNFLANIFGWFEGDYLKAIFLTTSLWTIGHVGVMDPNWVKMAQIFPIGLALGWLFKKYGAESTIIAHMVFNVAMLFSVEWLIV